MNCVRFAACAVISRPCHIRRTHAASQKEEGMSAKPEQDIEKDYPLPEFIDKLRRLADALERGEQLEIMIAG